MKLIDHLFEDCPTCSGTGLDVTGYDPSVFECEDCTNGRVLRKGVIYFEEGVIFEEGYWLPASTVEEET